MRIIYVEGSRGSISKMIQSSTASIFKKSRDQTQYRICPGVFFVVARRIWEYKGICLSNHHSVSRPITKTLFGGKEQQMEEATEALQGALVHALRACVRACELPALSHVHKCACVCPRSARGLETNTQAGSRPFTLFLHFFFLL